MSDADGIRDAGLQHIVGVNQKDGALGIELSKELEGGEFVLVEHHKGMGHGAGGRDVEHLAGQQGGAAGRAADVGCAGAVDRAVHIVGAAGSEVGNCAPLGGIDNALGLGGN